MAKKSTEAFEVPSLETASSEYAALIAKRQELQDRYSELNAERSKLRKDIEAAKAAGGQRLSAGVAALLGEDPVDSVTALTKRLREVATAMSDSEVAIEVLRRRISEERDRASKTVCDSIRQEHQRRLGVVCDCARALESAREEYELLMDALDAEDVRKDFLPPVRASFLGDRRQGRVFYFLKEVEASRRV
jgi:phage shock protein A